MKIWIDPPSGWRYGFPKRFHREVDGDIIEWMIREGYPEAEIQKLGEQFYWRSWAEESEPTEFRRGIPTKNG